MSSYYSLERLTGGGGGGLEYLYRDREIRDKNRRLKRDDYLLSLNKSTKLEVRKPKIKIDLVF